MEMHCNLNIFIIYYLFSLNGEALDILLKVEQSSKTRKYYNFLHNY